MGCALSSIEKEERVQICKERKKLMKQLLGFRVEFADAILAYLKALKNTGVTLLQFTESESSEPGNIPFASGLLTSSLPPLPPSPPPPPPPPPPVYSPDLRKLPENQQAQGLLEVSGDNGSIASPFCESTHHLGSSSSQLGEERAIVEDIDEENWAETMSQFEEDDQEHVSNKSSHLLPEILLNTDTVNGELSKMSGGQVKGGDMAMVESKIKKNLFVIAKELDEYFLKAYAGAKEIAIFVDMNTHQLHHSKESKGKGNNSARVLGSLSWSWSSNSMHIKNDTVGDGPFEPCERGAHCKTLEKLFTEEQILYKAVKAEEMKKLEHERKSLTLKKQENDNAEPNKIEKTQSAIESLQSDIVGLRELVKRTRSCILALIEEELHPQLVALLSGLIHMWKTMYKCHAAQIHICQQLKYLTNNHNNKPTTEYHRDATVQLVNEVNFWYKSFRRLIKCQKQYVNVLCKWIRLTDHLVDDENRNNCPTKVRVLCEKWQIALDGLSEKEVLEAITSFVLVIRAILIQQEEECKLKKKYEKIESRLHKEMEKKLEESVNSEDTGTSLSPKRPISIKGEKIAGLGKQYKDEKAKFLNSVQASRAMTLNNLHTCLPRVFQALMRFSSASAKAFETAISHVEQASDVEQSHVAHS